MFTKVKTDVEIENMRIAGKMLATVLQHVKNRATAGMSTKDLANRAAAELKTLGGAPSFLNYNGFPDVLCVSVNDEVVHGIPSEINILEDGDIVSIDFGVTYKGMVTDGALTFSIGNVDPKAAKLVAITERSLMAGIDVLKDGVRVGDIANAIQKVLDAEHYGIVRDLVGHGVGHELHEDPNIPNYGHAGSGPVLKAGMTIAIEPMATLGGYNVVMDDDNWTIRTKDHSLAAHFEHTVLITEKGYEILTVL
ncbi:type I methionyl aminopeptidase [soil metagenome]